MSLFQERSKLSDTVHKDILSKVYSIFGVVEPITDIAAQKSGLDVVVHTPDDVFIEEKVIVRRTGLPFVILAELVQGCENGATSIGWAVDPSKRADTKLIYVVMQPDESADIFAFRYDDFRSWVITHKDDGKWYNGSFTPTYRRSKSTIYGTPSENMLIPPEALTDITLAHWKWEQKITQEQS